MAGTNPAFNATTFRNAIKTAMQMGAPTSTSQQVTFHWTTRYDYSEDDADSSGYSWSWDATPVSTNAPADVRIDCAVEFEGGNEDDTTMGRFDNLRGVITVLDTDWPSLSIGGRMADQVTIDGSTYRILYVLPPIGLFEVTVYQIAIEAEDEA